jgi:tRNA threonylcarbamoyl adenosine modification protein YeaZ
MPKTYGLAIHTSSPELGFAISNFGGDQRSQAWDLGRDVSNQLHDRLQAFLTPQTWADLSFIAVAKGPGGFTGTRLGVVLARTLAQQLQIPLFGISSLAAIAEAEFVPHLTIAIEMPAQRGELYGAIYQDQQMILPDTIYTPEQWHDQVSQHQLGSPSKVKQVTAIAQQGQYASQLLALAHRLWQSGDRPSWQDTLPYYGQHPVR